MKISTKGRYALRMMLDLAVNESEEPIRIKDISQRQGISDKYLEQIVSVLNKAGFVKSIRGAQGGYRLVGKPCDYTVGMVLRLTEGNMAVVSCLGDDINTCVRQEECMTLPLWKKVNDAVKEVIDTTTLQDLIEWHKQNIKQD